VSPHSFDVHNVHRGSHFVNKHDGADTAQLLAELGRQDDQVVTTDRSKLTDAGELVRV